MVIKEWQQTLEPHTIDLRREAKAVDVSESSPKKPGVILVVDDEWMYREMMQAYLERSGYEVVLAHSGEKALEIVAAGLPDLILADIRMPGMNGHELCARLKGAAATRRVPVILLSGLDAAEDQRRGIEAGADDFAVKPLDMPLTLHRIKGLLRIKYLHDALESVNSEVREILSRRFDPATVEAIMTELATTQATRT